MGVTTEVCGEIRGETPAAILFFDGDKEVWIPKSQIEHQKTEGFNTITITIPEWLAYEKELI